MGQWTPADPLTTWPRGFRAAGIRAGIKTAGPDLALIVSDGAAVGAAVFTTSQFSAAPVLVSRSHAADGCLRAIIATSGCANACTGEVGLADARETAGLAAEALGISSDQVIVGSTGIIGHPLPMPIIRAAIPMAVEQLAPGGFADAAEAILTTDTAPKQAAVTVQIHGKTVTITGMAKGAGMVAPRMATVFGFFATDVAIHPALLDRIFGRAMDRSFNRVSVDSDTSTNDTACILASGAAGNATLIENSAEAADFESALTAAAEDLARQLARGGEGATHLVTVRVAGARTESDAETIARSVADSPLVKTAIFGQDPNWGRIAMAAGKAGVKFDQGKVDIFLNDVAMARNGTRVALDPDSLRNLLATDDIRIEVDLHDGRAEATVWTCDFSYDYVKINAEYHT